MEDRYLGDGVYASFDGFMIWLGLDGQSYGTVKIALEPEVFSALVQYNKDCQVANGQALPIPSKVEDLG